MGRLPPCQRDRRLPRAALRDAPAGPSHGLGRQRLHVVRPIIDAVESLHVSVNGERIELDRRISVADLLRRCRRAETPCAVEINDRVVPWREHPDHLVDDGDRIEIVTLVGGG